MFSLVGMGILFFVLSWIYARLISKMSAECQLKWSLWALVGFVGTLGTEAIFRWNQPIAAQYIIADIMIYVICASPAMIWLNWGNIRAWGYENINEDFYNMRFNGLIATWRNYVSSGRLLDILWPLFITSLWPIRHLLANTFWLDGERDVSDKES